AKNITPAPRRTPLQPNDPNEPVLGGTNGVRLAWFTYAAPAATNTISTAALIATSVEFTFADSLTPTIRSAATLRTMIEAGRVTDPGGPASEGGSACPTSRASETK